MTLSRRAVAALATGLLVASATLPAIAQDTATPPAPIGSERVKFGAHPAGALGNVSPVDVSLVHVRDKAIGAMERTDIDGARDGGRKRLNAALTTSLVTANDVEGIPWTLEAYLEQQGVRASSIDAMTENNQSGAVTVYYQ
jgi:hypothetical protein